jgi:tetratricopeptide (TPR) repeat protein
VELQDERNLSSCRKNLFAFTALAVIILAIYSNTFDASWHFDDFRNLLGHPGMQINSLTWSEIKGTLSANRGRLYRPVSALSLGLNYYFSGSNVFGYHLVNTAIHCFSAIFLFLFILHTLKLPALENRYGNIGYSVALLASMLWAINPVQTQAVTYVVQRMASLAGLFYILALYYYSRGKSASSKSSKGLFLALCTLSSLLSFGSKENTFVLPVSIVLYEIILVRKTSLREWFTDHKKLWGTVLLGGFGLAIVYLYFYQGGHLFSFLDGYQKRVFTLEQRLLTEPRVVFFYLSLHFYPIPSRLSLSHDFAVSQSFMEPITTIISILGIIALLAGAAISARRWPLLAFSVIFFFLNHLIESTFLPLELVFEHRNYVPSMLLFLPIAVLLVRGCLARSKKLVAGLSAIIIAVLVFGEAYATYGRNWIWETDETLWVDALSKAPGLWRPWHNVAQVYAERKDYPQALPLLMASLSKRTDANKNDKYLTHYNLGVVYQNLGQIDKALFHYSEAERIYSAFAGAHYNRGAIFFAQGHLDDAITELRKAATRDAGNQAKALSILGYLLIKAGKTKEAIYYLQIANRTASDDVAASNRLGYAYRNEGRFGNAYIVFKKSLQVEPSDINTHLYLAELYKARGMKVQQTEIMERAFFLMEKSGFDGFVREFLRHEEDASMLLNRSTVLDLLKEECRRQGSRFSGRGSALETGSFP